MLAFLYFFDHADRIAYSGNFLSLFVFDFKVKLLLKAHGKSDHESEAIGAQIVDKAGLRLNFIIINAKVFFVTTAFTRSNTSLINLSFGFRSCH